MLELKKYIRRIATNHPNDVSGFAKLQAMLPSYGQAGIDRLIELFTDEAAPEIARANALACLGAERSIISQRATPEILAGIEKACMIKTSEVVAEMALHATYHNALLGRVEAAEVVEKMRTGTISQRALFVAVDADFQSAMIKTSYLIHLTEQGKVN